MANINHIMKKLLTLLLLSPLAFATELSYEEAIGYVKKDLAKLTSLDSDCVGFYFGKPNDSNTSYSFELREIHNTKCGGDPDIAPIIASVKVSNTKKITVYNLLCNTYVDIDDYSWDMVCPVANEMVPLPDYLLERGDDLNESDMLYLTYRCIGLAGMMHVFIETASSEEAIDLMNSLAEAVNDLALEGEYLYNNLTPENDRNFNDEVRSSIIPLADNYMMEANNTQASTGDIFSDYINADINVCGDYVNSIRGKNE